MWILFEFWFMFWNDTGQFRDNCGDSNVDYAVSDFRKILLTYMVNLKSYTEHYSYF